MRRTRLMTKRETLKLPELQDDQRIQHRAPRVSVRDLMGESHEAILIHDGAEYRLRITAAGKLILTK